MNGRSSKAAGVTKFRLTRVESDTNGRMQNARYGVDGLRTKKQDADGNSSREYGAGISTSASTPLTQNSTAPSISYISGHMILGAEINGEFVYHLGDALSTVRDVVDDEGDVIRSFEFDEYGNMLSSSGSGATSPKTWIGGLSVNDDTADSGMFNMGHRNYAGGVLGRFISRDPIGFTGGLNLYAYPTSPTDQTDSAGLQPWPPDYRGQPLPQRPKGSLQPWPPGNLGTGDPILQDAVNMVQANSGSLPAASIQNLKAALKSGQIVISDNGPLLRLGGSPKGLEIGGLIVLNKESCGYGRALRLPRGERLYFRELLEISSVLAHESQHICQDRGSRLADENEAYVYEIQFLKNLYKRYGSDPLYHKALFNLGQDLVNDALIEGLQYINPIPKP